MDPAASALIDVGDLGPTLELPNHSIGSVERTRPHTISRWLIPIRTLPPPNSQMSNSPPGRRSRKTHDVS